MKMKVKLQIDINELEQQAISRANGRPNGRPSRQEARTFLFYVLKGGLSALADEEMRTRQEEIRSGGGKVDHSLSPQDMGAEPIKKVMKKSETSTVDGGSPPK